MVRRNKDFCNRLNGLKQLGNEAAFLRRSAATYRIFAKKALSEMINVRAHISLALARPHPENAIFDDPEMYASYVELYAKLARSGGIGLGWERSDPTKSGGEREDAIMCL